MANGQEQQWTHNNHCALSQQRSNELVKSLFKLCDSRKIGFRFFFFIFHWNDPRLDTLETFSSNGHFSMESTWNCHHNNAVIIIITTMVVVVVDMNSFFRLVSMKLDGRGKLVHTNGMRLNGNWLSQRCISPPRFSIRPNNVFFNYGLKWVLRWPMKFSCRIFVYYEWIALLFILQLREKCARADDAIAETNRDSDLKRPSRFAA